MKIFLNGCIDLQMMNANCVDGHFLTKIWLFPQAADHNTSTVNTQSFKNAGKSFGVHVTWDNTAIIVVCVCVCVLV